MARGGPPAVKVEPVIYEFPVRYQHDRTGCRARVPKEGRRTAGGGGETTKGEKAQRTWQSTPLNSHPELSRISKPARPTWSHES